MRLRAGTSPALDFGLPDPRPQRLRVNTQLPGHPGDLAMALTLPITTLEHHLHRALAQLLGVFPLCWHDSASSQGSEPPRSPGRSSLRSLAEASSHNSAAGSPDSDVTSIVTSSEVRP